MSARPLTVSPTPVHLHRNESPLGPSPFVRQALGTLPCLGTYPSVRGQRGIAAISARFGVAPDGVVVGRGAEHVLRLILGAVVEPGDEVVLAKHPFFPFPDMVRGARGVPVYAMAPGLAPDVGGLLAAVGPRTRVVLLANPHNPTGHVLCASEIRRLREALPDDVWLVLDGAYAEFVTDPTFSPGTDLVRTTRTVMVRSLSKLYGLAGLRIGWAYAPSDLAAIVRQQGVVFPLGHVAETALEAALADRLHEARVRSHVTRWRAWLRSELHGWGFAVRCSAANFLFLSFDSEDDARDWHARWGSVGVQVRSTAAFGLPHGLRVSVGSEADLRSLSERTASLLP